MENIVICVLGKKSSGKTTVANHLVSKFFFKELSLAEPLKKMCQHMLGLSEQECYDPLQKEVINERWNRTPRQILQYIGTDLLRNQFDKDIWVKLALPKITRPNTNIVIPDCRFRNEIEIFKQKFKKCYSIRVVKEALVTTDSHASETELDSYQEDFTVCAAHGQIPELLKQIDVIMKVVL